jgi:ATP-dependent 26S proteasome regulatory subunit
MNDSIISFVLDTDSPHMVGQPAEIDELRPSKYKWLRSENGIYAMVQNSETVDIIESGTYALFQDSRGGLHAERYEVETDELFILPNNHVNSIIKEIDDFWLKAPLFEKYKVKHKRGILLEGPGGTGKTSIINILAKKLIANGGLVFTVRNSNELNWYIDFMHNNLRVAEPQRNVIVIVEDIDKYMDGNGLESMILNWLDGEDSVDHQVVIATTNHFDDLNDLLLRPSRFDNHVEVPRPSPEIKEAYLINKGLDVERAKDWSVSSDDFSLAELKELFTSVILLDIDYQTAKEKINKQASNITNKTRGKTKKDQGKLGFFGNK